MCLKEVEIFKESVCVVKAETVVFKKKFVTLKLFR
jgi:hypothetical protein